MAKPLFFSKISRTYTPIQRSNDDKYYSGDPAPLDLSPGLKILCQEKSLVKFTELLLCKSADFLLKSPSPFGFPS